MEEQLEAGGKRLSNNPESIKGTVEAVLAAFPDTRNSDKLLQIKIWINDLKKVSKIINFKRLEAFSLKDCGSLTNPHTIIRVRQLIQNQEGKFPPTDPEVIKLRAKNKEIIEEWLRLSKKESIDYWLGDSFGERT